MRRRAEAPALQSLTNSSQTVSGSATLFCSRHKTLLDHAFCTPLSGTSHLCSRLHRRPSSKPSLSQRGWHFSGRTFSFAHKKVIVVLLSLLLCGMHTGFRVEMLGVAHRLRPGICTQRL